MISKEGDTIASCHLVFLEEFLIGRLKTHSPQLEYAMNHASTEYSVLRKWL